MLPFQREHYCVFVVRSTIKLPGPARNNFGIFEKGPVKRSNSTTMYLQKLLIENLGPINRADFRLPFHSNGKPKPLILVGPNGCGKTTVVSTIVNALVAFKQQVYENVEVESNRVFRLRGSRFIRSNARWYQVKLAFENSVSLEEWVLISTRNDFESSTNPLPTEDGWKKIPASEQSLFVPEPNRNNTLPPGPVPEVLSQSFSKNCVLYFPSDRFEIPDWINIHSLREDLRFPDAVNFQGQTQRRIFARALLTDTLEWLRAVVLDSRLSELIPGSVAYADGDSKTWLPGLVDRGGPNSRILGLCKQILERVLGADFDSLGFSFGNRNDPRISVIYHRNGAPQVIPSLLSLSAGQASLFCMLCNLIRDVDLQGITFESTNDIRGMVIIDEADLHLHVELQYYSLPKLIKLFPNVQFILTAHAPLLVMGFEREFGGDGFEIRSLPTGELISTDKFTEVENAIEVFVSTRQFDERVIRHVQDLQTPVVLVEGKTDKMHLEAAWKKLNPAISPPWTVVPCGSDESPDRGGAEMLRTVLRGCVLHSDRQILGLFDHDKDGMEQFNSLKVDNMLEVGTDRLCRKHISRQIHATVLPVPPGREDFVADSIPWCYLAIEHFYSDLLLERHGLRIDTVAKDSAIFAIPPKSKKKTAFAELAMSIPGNEFHHFKLLFDRIEAILGVTVSRPTESFALSSSAVCQAFEPLSSTIDVLQSQLSTTNENTIYEVDVSSSMASATVSIESHAQNLDPECFKTEALDTRESDSRDAST